ncbi:uncharacterized protein LOC128303765 [Anopheles moucheti]|uniref:uncharacterized protein LOC128303765 n=1 Tax=Anopheles moucheti TaxID=186751 RepID=UPI0022F107DB|nr:uncharacterized protein LOC128303765 [Anopheles moucheti]
MKSLLLLASVLCVALIVSARPSEETPDQETSTELSDDASTDDTQEEEAVDTDAESGTDGSETEGDDTGESESSPEEHSEGTESDGDEGTEGAKEGDAEGHEDGSEEGAADAADEQGGAEDGKESPRNTYNQVHKLLKNIMKVSMKDKYLKSFVLARLQERLMNPTIDLVSSIEKYSKIKECFSSLANDVSTLVKGSEKSYEECSKDKVNPNCGTEGTRDLDDGLIEREQELMDCIVEKRDAE